MKNWKLIVCLAVLQMVSMVNTSYARVACKNAVGQEQCERFCGCSWVDHPGGAGCEGYQCLSAHTTDDGSFAAQAKTAVPADDSNADGAELDMTILESGTPQCAICLQQDALENGGALR